MHEDVAIAAILIPIVCTITVFAALVAIIIVPRAMKNRERLALAETLRAGIEKGQPMPPEVIEALTADRKRPPSPARDLRTAVIWLAVAGALAVIGVLSGYSEGLSESYGWYGAATLPGFVGLAYLAFGLIGRDKGR